MSAQLAAVQMKWTKKLGEPLQENRYAFHAALSPEPNETWNKCFREIVEIFNRTSPFEASVHGSEAIVFGPLMAFEARLSKELEAAVSQTNEAYKRRTEQEAIEKEQRAARWTGEEKIRDDLRKKFVKE
jgi:hypothetical protein